jgi:hypothetical protein
MLPKCFNSVKIGYKGKYHWKTAQFLLVADIENITS